MLIWYFRGNQNAIALLSGTQYKDRTTSALCLMELTQGCINKEELKTIKEFARENIATIIHPDEKISERAITLLERHSLSDGLRTVDALIAASVISKESKLATSNYKHFKNITNLDVLKFEP